MENALYEIESMRRFAGLRLSDRLPDETTILNFRHFLEKHGLGKRIFSIVNDHLTDAGLILKEGTIVDATIIAAPSSTKNNDNARDPEMHQTKKGNEWHFGMKMHIGVDDTLGLIHSVESTPAKDRSVDWNIAKRASKRKQLPKDGIEERIEQLKASVRAIVEHPFRVIKCQFGYHKVRYRGLLKNTCPHKVGAPGACQKAGIRQEIQGVGPIYDCF